MLSFIISDDLDFVDSSKFTEEFLHMFLFPKIINLMSNHSKPKSNISTNS